MSLVADAVVVGGGIVGRCAALHLARLGAGAVVVVDRADRAGGTRRSAAVIRVVSADPVERELAALSLPLFRAWHRAGTGAFRPGGAVVVLPDGEAAAGRQLTAAQLAALVPWYRPAPGAVALLDPDGGTASPALALAALGAAMRRAGVRLLRGAAVTGLLASGGRLAGVETTTGLIRCGTAVVAAGPWTPAVLGEAATGLPIGVTRTPVLVLGGERPGGPPVVDLRAGVLVRPYGRRRWLVGTAHTEPAGQPVPDGGRADRAGREAVLRGLAAAAPVLAGAPVLASWTGFTDVTPDRRPLVGAVPGLAGAFVAAGLSGGGFKIGPAVGRLAAEAALGHPSRVPAAVAADRFAPRGAVLS